MAQKGEVVSVVLRLVNNLRHWNQSRFTGLIQFVIHQERVIRTSIMFPQYVSRAGVVMSLLLYFEEEFCFSLGHSRPPR